MYCIKFHKKSFPLSIQKLLFLLLSSISYRAFNQNQYQHSNQITDHHIKLKPKDSLCLENCFLKAHWGAHSRSFFMSTLNEGALKDDYALASGAGISLLTHPIFNFQVGVSGFFIYNLMSSDLSKSDSISGGNNRYEIGLFDLQNLKNKNDLDRLEELYLRYSYSKSAITIGKININTPFVNPQDGRMRPTLEEGAWLNIHESEMFGFNGGWLWAISPRSTVHWFTIENSMGVNATGINTNGTKSNYYHNISSKGLGIANVYFKPNDKIKLNVWNTWVENVMNTAMVEINTKQKINTTNHFFQGLMLVHQSAINSGGNNNPEKTYFDKNTFALAISSQLGVHIKNNTLSLNYTHITNHGRYTMPREWGREPFYTFLPRERNEGLGNVNAFMIKTELLSTNKKMHSTLGYGYYNLPDITNYKLNKYGLTTYHHFYHDYTYAFSKVLKGLELKFIAVYKLNGSKHQELKYVYNKVNLLNTNLIIDYKF